MRKIFITAAVLAISIQASAVEFLGVNLCRGSVDTSVRLPAGSGLSIASVEIGSRGALVMLLEGGADALDRVDDVLAGSTGARGTGNADQLQWSGNTITALARVLKKGQVALVVSSTDDCGGQPTLAEAPGAESSAGTPSHGTTGEASAAPDAPQRGETATPDGGLSATTAAIAAAAAEPAGASREPATAGPAPAGFELAEGFSHALAVDGWVDVMGVVTNHTGTDYRVATFDLATDESAWR